MPCHILLLQVEARLRFDVPELGSVGMIGDASEDLPNAYLEGAHLDEYDLLGFWRHCAEPPQGHGVVLPEGVGRHSELPQLAN